MTASTAINVFAKAVIRERRIPFEIAATKTDMTQEQAICGNRENQIYLVTGNLKHFPKDQYIISAREMLDILRRKFTDH